MKKILIIIMAFCSLTSCNNQEEEVDKSKLPGNDYRLFQGTPAWPLAKAVEAGDTAKIRELVSKGMEVDYQEPRFGNTLLMLAVINSGFESASTMLQLGADPNLKDSYRGTTAMIDAAANDDPNYIKLLLTHGGDPNAKETAPVKGKDMARETALNKAISYKDINNLERVKYLVEAGADVNYSNDGNPFFTNLPLADAFSQKRLDVVLYLLQHGADYKRIIYKMFNGHDVYILEALRKCVFDLQSPDYQKKLEVIAFLKGKGLDYYKEPIPDYILKEIKKKYPKNWEEYSRKY
ncbi:ankyrin repeat domain-containing protein [Arcticibacter sp.]|uniref:ankyrin repeat domain-containing protein n=1 Tax=Arcticibacter sp. TaxID=1872630 RepID=UPI00388E0A38